MSNAIFHSQVIIRISLKLKLKLYKNLIEKLITAINTLDGSMLVHNVIERQPVDYLSSALSPSETVEQNHLAVIRCSITSLVRNSLGLITRVYDQSTLN